MVKDSEAFYFTPGGEIEDGETKNQTIKRECKEELSTIPYSYKY